MNVSIGAHEGKLQPIKFGDYRDSGSGHIMAFLCYVTLKDHVIKSSCDFIEELIKISHHLVTLGCHKHFCSRDIWIYVCQVAL